MGLARAIRRRLERFNEKITSSKKRRVAEPVMKLEQLEPRLLLSGDTIVGAGNIQDFKDYFDNSNGYATVLQTFYNNDNDTVSEQQMLDGIITSTTTVEQGETLLDSQHPTLKNLLSYRYEDTETDLYNYDWINGDQDEDVSPDEIILNGLFSFIKTEIDNCTSGDTLYLGVDNPTTTESDDGLLSKINAAWGSKSITNGVYTIDISLSASLYSGTDTGISITDMQFQFTNPGVLHHTFFSESDLRLQQSGVFDIVTTIALPDLHITTSDVETPSIDSDDFDVETSVKGSFNDSDFVSGEMKFDYGFIGLKEVDTDDTDDINIVTSALFDYDTATDTVSLDDDDLSVVSNQTDLELKVYQQYGPDSGDIIENLESNFSDIYTFNRSGYTGAISSYPGNTFFEIANVIDTINVEEFSPGDTVSNLDVFTQMLPAKIIEQIQQFSKWTSDLAKITDVFSELDKLKIGDTSISEIFDFQQYLNNNILFDAVSGVNKLLKKVDIIDGGVQKVAGFISRFDTVQEILDLLDNHMFEGYPNPGIISSSTNPSLVIDAQNGDIFNIPIAIPLGNVISKLIPVDFSKMFDKAMDAIKDLNIFGGFPLSFQTLGSLEFDLGIKMPTFTVDGYVVDGYVSDEGEETLQASGEDDEIKDITRNTLLRDVKIFRPNSAYQVGHYRTVQFSEFLIRDIYNTCALYNADYTMDIPLKVGGTAHSMEITFSKGDFLDGANVRLYDERFVISQIAEQINSIFDDWHTADNTFGWDKFDASVIDGKVLKIATGDVDESKKITIDEIQSFGDATLQVQDVLINELTNGVNANIQITIKLKKYSDNTEVISVFNVNDNEVTAGGSVGAAIVTKLNGPGNFKNAGYIASVNERDIVISTTTRSDNFIITSAVTTVPGAAKGLTIPKTEGTLTITNDIYSSPEYLITEYPTIETQALKPTGILQKNADLYIIVKESGVNANLNLGKDYIIDGTDWGIGTTLDTISPASIPAGDDHRIYRIVLPNTLDNKSSGDLVKDINKALKHAEYLFKETVGGTTFDSLSRKSEVDLTGIFQADTVNDRIKIVAVGAVKPDFMIADIETSDNDRNLTYEYKLKKTPEQGFGLFGVNSTVQSEYCAELQFNPNNMPSNAFTFDINFDYYSAGVKRNATAHVNVPVDKGNNGTMFIVKANIDYALNNEACVVDTSDPSITFKLSISNNGSFHASINGNKILIKSNYSFTINSVSIPAKISKTATQKMVGGELDLPLGRIGEDAFLTFRVKPKTGNPVDYNININHEDTLDNDSIQDLVNDLIGLNNNLKFGTSGKDKLTISYKGPKNDDDTFEIVNRLQFNPADTDYPSSPTLSSNAVVLPINPLTGQSIIVYPSVSVVGDNLAIDVTNPVQYAQTSFSVYMAYTKTGAGGATNLGVLNVVIDDNLTSNAVQTIRGKVETALRKVKGPDGATVDLIALGFSATVSGNTITIDGGTNYTLSMPAAPAGTFAIYPAISVSSGDMQITVKDPVKFAHTSFSVCMAYTSAGITNYGVLNVLIDNDLTGANPVETIRGIVENALQSVKRMDSVNTVNLVTLGFTVTATGNIITIDGGASYTISLPYQNANQDTDTAAIFYSLLNSYDEIGSINSTPQIDEILNYENRFKQLQEIQIGSGSGYTVDQMIAAYNAKGYNVKLDENAFNLYGIRRDRFTGGDNNDWDDTIGVFFKLNGRWIHYMFDATTEPGDGPKALDGNNPIAIAKEGPHNLEFSMKSAGDGYYSAIHLADYNNGSRADWRTNVYRDDDADGIADMMYDTKTGGVGVNRLADMLILHTTYSGINSVPSNVYFGGSHWSEGCSVIQQGSNSQNDEYGRLIQLMDLFFADENSDYPISYSPDPDAEKTWGRYGANNQFSYTNALDVFGALQSKLGQMDNVNYTIFNKMDFDSLGFSSSYDGAFTDVKRLDSANSRIEDIILSAIAATSFDSGFNGIQSMLSAFTGGKVYLDNNDIYEYDYEEISKDGSVLYYDANGNNTRQAGEEIGYTFDDFIHREIGEGDPVFAKLTAGNKLVLITGYDGTNLIVMDPDFATLQTETAADISKLFPVDLPGSINSYNNLGFSTSPAAQEVSTADFVIHFSDDTVDDVAIDLSELLKDKPDATIKDLMRFINRKVDGLIPLPGKITLKLETDGSNKGCITIRDNTGGTGEFSITPVNGSAFADVWGITGKGVKDADGKPVIVSNVMASVNTAQNEQLVAVRKLKAGAKAGLLGLLQKKQYYGALKVTDVATSPTAATTLDYSGSETITKAMEKVDPAKLENEELFILDRSYKISALDKANKTVTVAGKILIKTDPTDVYLETNDQITSDVPVQTETLDKCSGTEYTDIKIEFTTKPSLSAEYGPIAASILPYFSGFQIGTGFNLTDNTWQTVGDLVEKMGNYVLGKSPESGSLVKFIKDNISFGLMNGDDEPFTEDDPLSLAFDLIPEGALSFLNQLGINKDELKLKLWKGDNPDTPDEENSFQFDLDLSGITDAFKNLSNISITDLLNKLKEFLTSDAFLDLINNENLFDTKIPLINKSINDLIDVNDRVKEIQKFIAQHNVRSIQDLDAVLKDAFGITGDIFELSNDGIKFNLGFDADFNENVDLNFGKDKPLAGNAELYASGTISTHLSFGVDWSDGLDQLKIVVYEAKDGDDADELYDSGTYVLADLNLLGDNLSFGISLEEFDVASIGPKDGEESYLALHGNFNAALYDTDTEKDYINISQISLDDIHPDFEANIGGILPVTAFNRSMGKIKLGTYSGTGNSLSIYDGKNTEGQIDALSDFKDLHFHTTGSYPTDAKIILDVSEVLDGLGNLGDLSILDKLVIAADGFDALLRTMENSFSNKFQDKNIPLIGDKLTQAAEFIGKFRSEFVSPVREFIDTAAQLGPEIVASFLYKQLHDKLDILMPFTTTTPTDPDKQSIWEKDLTNISSWGEESEGKDKAGVGYFKELNSAKSLVGAEWAFTVGDDYYLAKDVGLNLGKGDFSLVTEGGIDIVLKWRINLGFGVSESRGFYFILPAGNELSASIEAIMDGQVIGTLGFIEVTAAIAENRTGHTFSNTFAGIEAGIDLNNLVKDDGTGTDVLERKRINELTFDAKFGGIDGNDIINLGLDFTLGFNRLGKIEGPKLPSIGTTFLLNYDTFGGDLDIGFIDTRFNLGEFISDTIGKYVKKINEIIEPMKPIVDFLTDPLPIISDVGPAVTPIDLAEQYCGGDLDLGFIYAIDDIMEIVTALGNIDTSGDMYVPLGNLDVPDDGKATAATKFDTDPNSNKQEKHSKLWGLIDRLKKSNWDIPLITDMPTQIANLIMGKNVTLVEYDMPALNFEFNTSWAFQVWATPPIEARIGLNFGAKIDLGFGYDTQGFKDFAASGKRNAAKLLNGFYLTDYKDGKDIPELTLSAGISVAAGVTVGIASAGVGGGLGAEINFNLYDPDNDQKIRLYEITESIIAQAKYGDGNPLSIICAPFDIGGRITAEFFVYVNTIFTGEMRYYIVDDITIADFELKINRPAILATEQSGDVIVNAGQFADMRLNRNTTDHDEKFEINVNGNEINVKSNFQGGQKYHVDNGGKVIIDGGKGNDQFIITGTGSVDFEITGGEGDDIIDASGYTYTGDKGFIVKGGEGNDQIKGTTGNDILFGEAGNDLIYGMGGSDVVFGDIGFVRDDKKNFEVLQFSDSDGNDILYGDDGSEPARIGGPVHVDGDDIIFGAGGNDNISGDGGNDYLIGDSGRFQADMVDPVDKTTQEGGGDDVIIGGSGEDHFYAGTGNDKVHGGAGNDQIYGDAGDDLIFGGSGDDTIYAGDGMDVVFGEWCDIEDISIDFPLSVRKEAQTANTFAITFQGSFDSDDDPVEVVDTGSGSDTIYGESGSDIIYGDTGENNPDNPQSGYDTIYGGLHNDLIDGDWGYDTIYGNSGADIIYGGAGNDILDGGADDDIVFGDQGMSAFVNVANSKNIFTSAYEYTASGSVLKDVFERNKIFGDNVGQALGYRSDIVLKADNTSGNDIIMSGRGMDLIDGQGGDDTYNVMFLGGENLGYTNVGDSGVTGGDKLTINGTVHDDRFLLRSGNKEFDTNKNKLSFVALVPDPEEEALDTLYNKKYIERVNFWGSDADMYGIDDLTVNGITGDDFFALDDTGVKTRIYGGTGNDFFQVGQLFKSTRDGELNPDSEIAVIDSFNTSVTSMGYLSNGISYDCSINGDTGDDYFMLYNNQAMLMLDGSWGNDTFSIKSFTEVKRDDILIKSPMDIRGGRDNDTISITGSEKDDVFVITQDGIYGCGVSINVDGIEKFQADGAEGDDTFYILGTMENTVTIVNGGEGNDTVYTGGSEDAIELKSRDYKGHNGIIKHKILDADGTNYANVAIKDVMANIIDNDSCGPEVICTKVTGGDRTIVDHLETEEGKSAIEYAISLSNIPSSWSLTDTDKIIVTVSVSDATPSDKKRGIKDLVLSRSSSLNSEQAGTTSIDLVFTKNNWNTVQTIYLYAPDDVYEEEDITYYVTHSLTCKAKDYKVNARPFTVTVLDRTGETGHPSVDLGTMSDTVEIDIPAVQNYAGYTATAQLKVGQTVTGGDNTGIKNISVEYYNASTKTVTVLSTSQYSIDGTTLKVKGSDIQNSGKVDLGKITIHYSYNNFEVAGETTVNLNYIPEEPDELTVALNGTEISKKDADSSEIQYILDGKQILFYNHVYGTITGVSGFVTVTYTGTMYVNTPVATTPPSITKPEVIIKQSNDSTDVVEGGKLGTSDLYDVYSVFLSQAPKYSSDNTGAQIKVRITPSDISAGGIPAHKQLRVYKTTDFTGTGDSVELTFNSSNYSTEQKVYVLAVDDSYVESDDLMLFPGGARTLENIDGAVYADGAGGASSFVSSDGALMLRYSGYTYEDEDGDSHTNFDEENLANPKVTGFTVSGDEIVISTDQLPFELRDTDFTVQANLDDLRKSYAIKAGDIQTGISDADYDTVSKKLTLTLNKAITSTEFEWLLGGISQEEQDVLGKSEESMVDRIFIENRDDILDQSGVLDRLINAPDLDFGDDETGSNLENKEIRDFILSTNDAMSFSGFGLTNQVGIGGLYYTGGINYGNFELCEINLGTGEDLLRIEGASGRPDGFSTWTIVNSGDEKNVLNEETGPGDTIDINNYKAEQLFTLYQNLTIEDYNEGSTDFKVNKGLITQYIPGLYIEVENADGIKERRTITRFAPGDSAALFDTITVNQAFSSDVSDCKFSIISNISALGTIIETDNTTPGANTITISSDDVDTAVEYGNILEIFDFENKSHKYLIKSTTDSGDDLIITIFGELAEQINADDNYRIYRQAGDGNLAVNTQAGDDTIDAYPTDDEPENNGTISKMLVLFGGLGKDTIHSGSNSYVFGDRGRISYCDEDTTDIITLLGTTTGVTSGEYTDYTTTSVDNGGNDQVKNRYQTDGVNRDPVLFETIQNDAGGIDTITIFGNNNIVFGGNAGDSISINGSTNIVIGDGGQVVGEALRDGDELVWGDFSPVMRDYIETTADNIGGSDVIRTGDGSNIILGGYQEDDIKSGAGDDIIFGDGAHIEYTDGILVEAASKGLDIGFDDTIDSGTGVNVIVGGLGDDYINAGHFTNENSNDIRADFSNDKDYVVGDNGRKTFNGNGAFGDVYESSTISFNFSGTSQYVMSAADRAGVWTDNNQQKAANWNQIDTQGPAVIGNDPEEFVYTHRGDKIDGITMLYGASEDCRDDFIRLHEDLLYSNGVSNPTGDQKMFSGMVRTSETDSANNLGVRLRVEGLANHFKTYDVYIYLDANDNVSGGSDSQYDTSIRSVTIDSESVEHNTYYVNDVDGHTFYGTYEQATATTPGAATAANYVKFSGLTENVFNVIIKDIYNGLTGQNLPSIAGIQIVGISHNVDTVESLIPTNSLMLGGNDTISTSGGDDVIVGGTGMDIITSFGDIRSGINDADLIFGDDGIVTDRLDEVVFVKSLMPEASLFAEDPDYNDDIIIAGNGNDLIFGGYGADLIDSQRHDNADSIIMDRIDTINESDKPEVLKDSYYQQLKNFEYDNLDVLSINFARDAYNVYRRDVEVLSDEYAGAVAAKNWNNIWRGDTSGSQLTFNNLTMNNGQTNSQVSLTLSINNNIYACPVSDEHDQIDADSANSNIFNSSLSAQQQDSIQVKLTNLLQGTSYTSYDVYVYIDGDNEKTAIGEFAFEVKGGDPANMYNARRLYIEDWEGAHFDGEFRGVDVETGNPGLDSALQVHRERAGNFVVFKNVTSNNFLISLQNYLYGNQQVQSQPTISGVQVVYGADKDNVVLNGDYDKDVVVGDNGEAVLYQEEAYSNLAANRTTSAWTGIERQNKVTRVKSYLQDGAISDDDYIVTGVNNDNVIAGNGADAVDSGAGNDLIAGDNAQLYLFNYNAVNTRSPSEYNFMNNDDNAQENTPDPIPYVGDIGFNAFTVKGVSLISSSYGGNDIIDGGKDNDLIYGQEGTVDLLITNEGDGDVIADPGNDEDYLVMSEEIMSNSELNDPLDTRVNGYESSDDYLDDLKSVLTELYDEDSDYSILSEFVANDFEGVTKEQVAVAIGEIIENASSGTIIILDGANQVKQTVTINAGESVTVQSVTWPGYDNIYWNPNIVMVLENNGTPLPALSILVNGVSCNYAGGEWYKEINIPDAGPYEIVFTATSNCTFKVGLANR